MNVVNMVIGAGCNQKVEAAFRFLHGVVRADVGHVSWPPGNSRPDKTWSSPPALWRVDAVHLAIDLDEFQPETLMAVMEVLVEEHAAEVSTPLCHRKLWAVGAEMIAPLTSFMKDQGKEPWTRWLFEQASFLRSPDEDQDSYVRKIDSEYSEKVILPCLCRLMAKVPAQFDLDT